MHTLHIVAFILYVYFAYLERVDFEVYSKYAIALGISIFYPWIYDLIQLCKDGPSAYFSDSWNYVDFMYIYCSVANLPLQILLGPAHHASMTIMCMIVILLLIKTFFFLRILTDFTPIVIMLTNVIYDLQQFLFFYIILVFMFSFIFAVMGLGLVGV